MMSRSTIVSELVERAHTDGDDYFEVVSAIALILPKSLHEQLYQLVHGPTWDGDVICKSYRDELLDMGLAARICCKGEQGYTGGTYIGYSVLQKLPKKEAG